MAFTAGLGNMFDVVVADTISSPMLSSLMFDFSDFVDNPVYQELQISLNRTNIEIAEIERRIVALRSDIAELQERVDVVPEVR